MLALPVLSVSHFILEAAADDCDLLKSPLARVIHLGLSLPVMDLKSYCENRIL